jgi:hypothetical protein
MMVGTAPVLASLHVGYVRCWPILLKKSGGGLGWIEPSCSEHG